MPLKIQRMPILRRIRPAGYTGPMCERKPMGEPGWQCRCLKGALPGIMRRKHRECIIVSTYPTKGIIISGCLCCMRIICQIRVILQWTVRCSRSVRNSGMDSCTIILPHIYISGVLQGMSHSRRGSIFSLSLRGIPVCRSTGSISAKERRIRRWTLSGRGRRGEIRAVN